MSRDRIASLIGSKVCKQELSNAISLGYSDTDARFSAFAALEETVQRATGPTPLDVWPRFTKIERMTE
jgi:hypothetical protein